MRTEKSAKMTPGKSVAVRSVAFFQFLPPRSLYSRAEAYPATEPVVMWMDDGWWGVCQGESVDSPFTSFPLPAVCRTHP